MDLNQIKGAFNSKHVLNFDKNFAADESFPTFLKICSILVHPEVLMGWYLGTCTYYTGNVKKQGVPLVCSTLFKTNTMDSIQEPKLACLCDIVEFDTRK